MPNTLQTIEEDLKFLTNRAPHMHSIETFNYYGPILLKLLASTAIPLAGKGSQKNTNHDQPAGRDIAPTFHIELYGFVAEYLKIENINKRITTEHVLLAGLLLQLMHAINQEDTTGAEIKLRTILLTTEVTLSHLYSYESNSDTSIVFATPTKTILTGTLSLVTKIRIKDSEELATATANILKLYRNDCSLHIKLNKDFKSLLLHCIRNNSNCPASPAQTIRLIQFLLDYPCQEELHKDTQELLFHVLLMLITHIQDEATHKLFLGRIISVIASSAFSISKADLISYTTKSLKAPLKLMFIELLNTDLQQNKHLYSTEALTAIYDSGLALHNAAHLHAQCKDLLQYLAAAGEPVTTIPTSSRITDETMNHFWSSINLQALRMLATTNFSTLKKPELERLKLDDAYNKYKDRLEQMKLLAIKLLRFTTPIGNTNGIYSRNIYNIKSNTGDIARFLKNVLEEHTELVRDRHQCNIQERHNARKTGVKSEHSSQQQPVRLFVEGIRTLKIKKSNEYAIKSGSFFISMQYDDSLNAFEVYNPNSVRGSMYFKKTEHTYNEIAKHLLEIYRATIKDSDATLILTITMYQHQHCDTKPMLFNHSPVQTPSPKKSATFMAEQLEYPQHVRVKANSCEKKSTVIGEQRNLHKMTTRPLLTS